MPSPERPRRKGSSTLSRRSFLQGVGTGAAAVVVAPKLAHSRPWGTEEIEGSTLVSIRLRVNGKTYKLRVQPRETLLDALRNHLNLTGTKRVCDRGECGACTVLRDGKPIYSCLTLALEAQDQELETIEGLSPEGKLHPLQEAFVKHDALQCGFCTPGMVMSLKVLLDREPNPSLDDVKQAISGNLCKCGTYSKIFRAARDAAQTLRGRRS